MSDIDSGATLSLADIETYKMIVSGKAVGTRDVSALLAIGLIQNRGGRFHALDPRGATNELLATVQTDLASTISNLALVPVLEGLVGTFDLERFFGGAAGEFLPSREQMNARIGEVTGAATHELYAAQPEHPVDRSPEMQAMGTARTVAALARGVHVRTIYPAAGRDHAQTQSYVGEVMALGAEVRTLSVAFPRMIVIDRDHLFIENHTVARADQHAGWHMTDHQTVLWARALFEMMWEPAAVWGSPGKTTSGAAAITARQHAILRALAAGGSQDQVAAQIGLAPRTVNKEVAELRLNLGMKTVNQLMAWYGRSTANHE
ncbi:LuxR C-terminal-related transcriptional regulator [Streptomyces liangshanensis]|uniref:LuxR C-terminal-related transcriptional regulator n=1 Tax=Streptomyces liangshanensis TaxID=2717324 RepID=UPI0036DF891B